MIQSRGNLHGGMYPYSHLTWIYYDAAQSGFFGSGQHKGCPARVNTVKILIGYFGNVRITITYLKIYRVTALVNE